VLILYKQKHYAFSLVIVNLVLCLLMLLHHATDVLKIRL
jgi:hypothetical protein